MSEAGQWLCGAI